MPGIKLCSSLYTLSFSQRLWHSVQSHYCCVRNFEWHEEVEAIRAICLDDNGYVLFSDRIEKDVNKPGWILYDIGAAGLSP